MSYEPKVSRRAGGDWLVVETDNGGRLYLEEPDDDGVGVVEIVNAGVPTDGTSGTGAGYAQTGSRCIDKTNGKIYVNENTAASPLWTVLGTQTT